MKKQVRRTIVELDFLLNVEDETVAVETRVQWKRQIEPQGSRTKDEELDGEEVVWWWE